ncbi:hypothetical protein Oweho_0863 [Owenweeksia hongkongensis DSM 17368]|uniref:YbbR-like protein n=1 Tax=Owenweeksia hongkongensis (strain DSM 17368 / CIP 108786 / JCM 12287 / NRRL B-23963 / UST20020801) TaxID=926562 RepID=G8R2R9_OWEHD|nr:CdaR family protein [Owenweeksia hongkongensis]AEV31874.1 hypothetical protein Oweho_0863 [Owenweeksia hongkongensis DSM 17368]
MANNNLENIKEKLLKLGKPLLAGDNRAKVLCIILSVFLWFLIKLSKEGYTGEVNFPVIYKEVPANKKLLNQPIDHLKVTLRSQGFEILKYKIRSLRPIEIDVSRLDMSNAEHYTWNTQSRRNMISSQLGDNTEIVDIKPDTVHFNFSLVRSKKVKVYFKGKRQISDFKTLYAEPVITPDSVMISGSEQTLSQIDSLFIKPISPSEDTDSLDVEVELQMSKNKDLEIIQEKVRVQALYTSLTEGKFEIPVKVINLPKSYNITLFPNKVFVKYQLALEDFSKVSKDDFEAYVDYDQIESMENDRFLTVYMESSPPYLKKLIIDPKQLEFIITEK